MLSWEDKKNYQKLTVCVLLEFFSAKALHFTALHTSYPFIFHMVINWNGYT